MTYTAELPDSDGTCRLRDPDGEVIATVRDWPAAVELVKRLNFPGQRPTAGRGPLQPRPATYSDEVKQ